MAIGNLQVIDIGLPNESTGSDSLYDAFTKTKTNFATLFGNASPFNTFTGNTGISVTANANAGTVDILNTGVTSIVAGPGISINSSNGAVTITNTGGNGNGSGVTSVGVTSSTLSVSNSPIVSAGNIVLNLPTTGITAGTYTNPTVVVDTYGRVTNIANNTVSGTVTSVGVTPGTGISVTNSPITSSGNITVTNTGVTRLSQGSGIILSGSNGDVTISTAPVSAVTGVAITSSSLTVTGSPITTSGTITVNLPSAISITGNITGGNLITTGLVTVTGNANIGNIGTAGVVTATGNIGGGNINTAGVVSATGNISGGNLILTTGNIIYTPRYGSFYSNTTQTNPVANTAMAMTFNNTSSANGVSITSSSRLTVAKAGTYNIQFSAQCTKTDAGTDYIEIWLSKNGTSVPWSSTRLKLEGSNVYQIASWNFVETLGASEYVQIMWGSADLNAQLVAIPSANTTMGIDVPSVIVTVTPVGA